MHERKWKCEAKQAGQIVNVKKRLNVKKGCDILTFAMTQFANTKTKDFIQKRKPLMWKKRGRDQETLL